ncbi:MAG TPA: alkaline phosphatase family protein, partial [Solirubrobacteraceae bacterium]|nr:alkaline phosphatase family protein [Solirubrobacteraceae bacterium]
MSWTHRIRYLVLGLALVGGLALLPTHAARADSQCANHCVMLIEVNGLENKDVTPQSTPFLWALAHPGKTNASATPALTGRSGWMWQASRGILSSSNAASTASLLTGGFPEETGVPADEYIDRFDKTPNKLMRLGDPGDAGAITTGTAQTLIYSATQADVKTATFIGDPALRTIVDGGNVNIADAKAPTPGDATYTWYPAGQAGTQDGNGDPKLCPAPNAQDSAGGGSGTPTTPSGPPICPANDLQTMKEMSDYLTGTTGGNISLTYAYLAELGIAKQHNGNAQASSGSPSAAGGPPSSGGTPSVAQALQDTDAAIAQFVASYQTARGDQWKNTVMMVVGNHGYELTPTSQRVPQPDPSQPGGVDPKGDLATYVAASATAKTADTNSALLIPQGSMATIYYTDTAHPEKKAETLADLRDKLLTNVNATPPCKNDPGGTGQCIAEVLYVNPADVPADHPEYGLTHQHPSWRQQMLSYKAC